MIVLAYNLSWYTFDGRKYILTCLVECFLFTKFIVYMGMNFFSFIVFEIHCTLCILPNLSCFHLLFFPTVFLPISLSFFLN